MVRFIRCGFTVLIDGDDDGSMDHNDDIFNMTMTNADDDLIIDNNNSTRLLLHTYQNQYFFSRFLDGATNKTPVNDDDYSSANMTFKYDGCETTYSMSVIILLIMSVAFLFFTCCMLFEQIDAIETNMSKIARMKRRMGHADAHEYARVSQDFNEFFGGNSPSMSLHWFLPLPLHFPPGRKDRLMGFEYRDEWYGEPYREEMDDDDVLEEGGRDVGDEEIRIGMDHHGELKLGDFSTHDDKKLSSLVATEEDSSELKLELPMGNDDIKISKNGALKKRA